MLQNVHEAHGALEATKADREKATFDASVESKVRMTITSMWTKIDIAQRRESS